MNIPITEVSQRLKDGRIKIAIFGLGRIGLPTAVLFAEKGLTVFGIDAQDTVIQAIKAGDLHIDEPGLYELLKKVTSNGKFNVTTDAQMAMKVCDVAVICVPTPITSEKVPDYTQIIDVCENGLRFIKEDDLIIIESTISPGTIETVIIP
ncbi:MAG: 2-dehydropantoate 2-reductase N-terminal domain-containing protein, partial [Candidatus Helarchaeota archaeon]